MQKHDYARAAYLKELAQSHSSFNHELFRNLRDSPLDFERARALLLNYDAHAMLLRRLLLHAAAIMPEPAVGFILENVRNEYGNGDYADCHQGQLADLIKQVEERGELSKQESLSFSASGNAARLEEGVRKYMREITRFYRPNAGEMESEQELLGLSSSLTTLSANPDISSKSSKSGYYRPAVAAGAITATEILAIEEFKAMQSAFRPLGLAEHRWFDHVNVECEHGDESLCLAEYFIKERGADSSVQYGLQGALDCNMHLYDGLLAASYQKSSSCDELVLSESCLSES